MRLELYYPLKPYIPGQEWGANRACAIRNPDGSVSGVVGVPENQPCPPGKKRLYTEILDLGGHPGEDQGALWGQRLSASIKGKVLRRSTTDREGLGVFIISDVPYDLDPQPKANFLGGSFYVELVNGYHMKSIAVQDEEDIELGEPLGEADTTGMSAGNHNHFAGRPKSKNIVNGKVQWIDAIQNKFQNTIDMSSYWTGIYAEDMFKPRHKFLQDLEVGMKWLPDIAHLQKILIYEGLFPEEIGATSIFGNITKEAVVKFQMRYGIRPIGRVGPVTRAQLNLLYGK